MTGSSVYDVTVGGLDFFYATDANNPMIRQTVPYTKDRVDQAEDAGEQTLTAWWLKSQESFHGGAGQLNLEPSQETPLSHARFLLSKNVDPFVPGQVRALPNCPRIASNQIDFMVASVDSNGDEWITWARGSTVTSYKVSNGTTVTYSNYSGPAVDLVTDGLHIFLATEGTLVANTGGQLGVMIWVLNPLAPTAPVEAYEYVSGSFSQNVTIGWEKSRLMLAVNNQVYACPYSTYGGSVYTFNLTTDLVYRHPNPAFVWRCFASGPQGLLAAGDGGGGVSTITTFTDQNVSGVPTLQVVGDVAQLPTGEHVLSLLGIQGSFLAVGTDRGIRVGVYDAYYGTFSLGPLTLDSSQPQIPCNKILSRDRFIYAFGKSYDEGGCITVDLGTQVDQSGRYAWAPGVIPQIAPTNGPSVVTSSAAMLPKSNLMVFDAWLAGDTQTGVFLESATNNGGRTAWLQTSRIRYGTVEPKLFKWLRVRGTSALSGTITATAVTDLNSTPVSCGTFGLVSSANSEKALPDVGAPEWLCFTFTFSNAVDIVFNSYGAKALPATPRERHIQLSLMCYDSETSRNGQTKRQKLSARTRVSNLEALDTAGNVTTLVEHTPKGDVSTVVVIEDCQFKMDQRSTNTSDWGGTVTLLLRTVGA